MTDHEPNRTHISVEDADQASPPADPSAPDDSTSASESTGKQDKQTSLLREIIETALLALLIFVAVRAVVLNFKVDGLSMEPNFKDGEMLLVNRNAYGSPALWDLVDWMPFVDEREDADPIFDFGDPERGDVVVFKPLPPGQDKPYIKRVIGLPGDTIDIHDDNVFVNGTRLDEPYLEGRPTSARSCKPEYCDGYVVPEGQVFVLGDNRNNSEDSRYFGAVPDSRIIGKAWLTYWPVDLFGTVPHHDYPELAAD